LAATPDVESIEKLIEESVGASGSKIDYSN
jgi:hypothetical protein